MAKQSGKDVLLTLMSKMEQLQREFEHKARADEAEFARIEAATRRLVEVNRSHAERVHGLFTQFGQALGAHARQTREDHKDHEQRLKKLEELLGG